MLASIAWLTLVAGQGPFIDVPAARSLPAAVVLDARGDAARPPYLPAAQVVEWTDIRAGWLRSGKLDAPAALRSYFSRRGVDEGRPVLVYGAMQDGWGEEGRIWWTLRYLGLREVYIVDGGIRAWVSAGAPTVPRPGPRPKPGRLTTTIAARWRADWRQVNALRGDEQAVVLDVRTRQEYDGQTPYWSARGGHVPGARWLYWKELLRSDGRLLTVPELKAKLGTRGLAPSHKVVAYCTGGVRSAFVIAALAQAGFTDVANYDGSWWEWSARWSLPVE